MLGRVPSVITIHNLGYQGNFPAAAISDLGLSPTLFHPGGLEFWGELSFLKAGIVRISMPVVIRSAALNDVKFAIVIDNQVMRGAQSEELRRIFKYDARFSGVVGRHISTDGFPKSGAAAEVLAQGRQLLDEAIPLLVTVDVRAEEESLRLMAQRFERLQSLAELKIPPFLRRRPIVLLGAVGGAAGRAVDHLDASQASLGSSGCSCDRSLSGDHGVQQRQR